MPRGQNDKFALYSFFIPELLVQAKQNQRTTKSNFILSSFDQKKILIPPFHQRREINPKKTRKIERERTSEREREIERSILKGNLVANISISICKFLLLQDLYATAIIESIAFDVCIELA